MLYFKISMKKIKLEIVGMSYSQSQSGAYALVLGVPGESRRLPIIIGGFEAQAIAIELEKMQPSRPLTHDLFKNFAENFGIDVTEVVINKFEEGIFYSKLICSSEHGETEIDSRTSDAVALAIRFKCPIYVYYDVLEEAGIIMTDEEGHGVIKDAVVVGNEGLSYNDYLNEELEDLLKKAIAEEDFEEASKLRDEINRRKEL
jgi:bifunctional DNase/RNase